MSISRKKLWLHPLFPNSARGEAADPIDIRVDVIHPELVAVVAFPVAAIARVKIEQQLAVVQESQRQDREDFRKLKELMTSQFDALHRYPPAS
ncbi:hypothetical protein Tco_0859695 [Tanacetum coccineum]|uniref:Uncharacterized protein n=1 Tax=Tanacetum coccineum TaxID=301880 RepID=A0ABQ5BDQ3_9ASTR